VGIERRALLKGGAVAGALDFLGAALAGRSGAAERSDEESLSVSGLPPLDRALQICANTYPANRRHDMLSATNPTGYRMTVSPNGFPVAICMSPDLTFGLLGSRFVKNGDYWRTLRGHLDHLPRNMRRNGRFFINEDLLSGADRVFTQVMYLLWIWELYRASGDKGLLQTHREPMLRCLGYIESRTDEQGVVNQVDPDDWQVSEGADWVDWYPERMEGSTCVYHTWYVRALAGCIRVLEALGDAASAEMCRKRHARQRGVLDSLFWNGAAYWDNIRFQGGTVGRFWCDSQIWPIAWGYASREQSSRVFGRIDAEPKVFEGVPLRWCAPVPPGEEDPRYARGGKYDGQMMGDHQAFTWFGRLGAGDIVARYATGQDEHALKLILRYAEVVAREGTVPECLDMDGIPRHGTGGQGNYLEHAGGFLWCVGKGLFGIDDFDDGSLVWSPRIPDTVGDASGCHWHMGHAIRYGCTPDAFWLDPGQAQGAVRFTRGSVDTTFDLRGKRITIPRRRVSTAGK
jgi:hypothetical protein